MYKVSIHSLGYTNLNIPKLCSFLNSSQHHYIFVPGTKITNLGNPDLAGYGYSVAALYRLAQPHLPDDSVGVLFTSVPIEDNFFTKTMNQRIVISTFHQADELMEKSGRTIEEYAALTISQELLSFEFQRVTGKKWYDLFHQDPRECLFDFAGIKTQKIGKLVNCSICEVCLGTLQRENINVDALQSIRKILNRIVKPSIRKAILTSVLRPGLSFIYGGIVFGSVVNLFSSLALSQGTVTRGQYLIVISIASGIILFPLAVYGWQWLQFLKRRMS
jgi:hypothetical protein